MAITHGVRDVPERDEVIRQLQEYAILLDGQFPDTGVSNEVRAILTARRKGLIPRPQATLRGSAQMLYGLACDTTKELSYRATILHVAFDLLAMSQGNPCPPTVGHYYRQSESLGLSPT